MQGRLKKDSSRHLVRTRTFIKNRRKRCVHFLLPCPEPQNTLQINEKLPAVSAVNVVVCVCPGASCMSTSYCTIASPCVTSVLLAFILTVSPRLTVIVLGSNENCFAVMLNSFTETVELVVLGGGIVEGDGICPATVKETAFITAGLKGE